MKHIMMFLQSIIFNRLRPIKYFSNLDKFLHLCNCPKKLSEYFLNKNYNAIFILTNF